MAMILMERYIDTTLKTLLEGKQLTSGDNLNTITDVGIYWWTGNSQPSNVPAAASGSMIILRWGGSSYSLQIVFTTSNIYLRGHSTSWGAWTTIS